MDSFGRAQKYASNRKQELQLQDELKAIRNKALLDRYLQLHATEAEYPSQREKEELHQAAAYSPKPPSQPKPSSSSRKRVRLNQPATKVSTRDIQVSSGPVCKPLTGKKLVEKGQHKPLTTTANQPDKKLSPQKVVLDTSTNVKFAIVSSLDTSVPVKHVQRDKPKAKDQTIKKTLSEAKAAKRLTKTRVNDFVTTKLVSHDDSDQMDPNVVTTQDQHADVGGGFSSSSSERGGWAHTSYDESIGQDSFQGSSVDLSFGSQSNIQTDQESPSETGLRPSSGESLNSQPETQAKVTQALSGTLMLEVDMRFKSTQEHVSEASQLSFDRESPDVSHPSLRQLSVGTSAEQSAASLKDFSDGGDDQSSTDSQVDIEQKPSLYTQSDWLLTTPGMEEQSQLQTSTGSIGLKGQEKPLSPNSETEQDIYSNVTASSIGLDGHKTVQETDIIGVQSEVTISELDQTSQSHNSALHLDLLQIDSQSKVLQTGVDSNDGSSSTLKASEDKGSMFFSVGGSLSSFGTPFSMQSQSHSLADTTSRELTTSTDSHTPKYSPSLKSDSQASVQGEKATRSKPNIDHFLLTSSDQHVATSSWLKSISGNVDFISESNISDHGQKTDDSLDALDVNLKDTSAGFMSRSDIHVSSSLQEQSVVKLDWDRNKDSDHVKSVVDLDSHPIVVDHTLIETKPDQMETDIGKLNSLSVITIQKGSNQQGEECVPHTVVGADLQAEKSDGGIPHGGLPEFLAYSESPVTLEDILNITGQKLPGQQKEAQSSPLAQPLGITTKLKQGHKDDSPQPQLTFLSTWDSSTSNQNPLRTSIHHFCTSSVGPQLPIPVQILSRQTHAKPLVKPSEDEVLEVKQTSDDALSCSTTAPPPNTPRSPKLVKQKAVLSKQKKQPTKSTPGPQLGLSVTIGPENITPGDEGLVITGAGMQAAKNPSNLLWTPAPPKLSLHPSTIQAQLFPQYKTVPTSTAMSTSVHDSFVQDSQQLVMETTNKVEELQRRKSRLLDPAFRSVPNFSSLLPELTSQPAQADSEMASIIVTQDDEQSIVSTAPPDKIEEETKYSELDVPSISVRKSRFSVGSYPASEQPGGIVSTSTEAKAVCTTAESDDIVRHTQSLPLLPPVSDGVLLKPNLGSKEFDKLMTEVASQREQLVQYHKELREPKEEVQSTNELNESNDIVLSESMCATSGTITSRKLQRQILRGTKKVTGKGGGTAGRIRALRRTKSVILRTEWAKETLSLPPRKLKRRGSHPMIKDELVQISQQHTEKTPRPSHHSSLSQLTDTTFLALMVSQGGNVKDDPYKWALNLWWDTWFPEVLKECREAVAELSTGRKVSTSAQRKAQPKSTRKQSVTAQESTPEQPDWNNMLLELENLEPMTTQLMNSEMFKTLETEVTSLTQTIADSQDTGILAIHYCRRGALFRKLCRLKESLSDLNHALSLQPTLSDAYWHRHLLFLLQGNEKAALDDLTLLLKQNKKHFGAFRSKAHLLVKKGDLASAVYNMTQAIALQPDDPESYFLRAELYEKRGEVESALSDYARVSELDPDNLEALSRPAMHKFNKGMWSASTHHFAALLVRDPNNTEARIYRARANYNLGRYMEALQDLSAAIHLDPNGSQAFYHRACLLRNSLPKQALKDFSVSLLLDDSAANVHSFIHRGVLYTQLKCYDEALLDFESAVRLQRTLPSSHVCAGLIHLHHKKNITRAIRCFSAGIFVDPTCIRAYLCRAEAYRLEAKYKLAILDYTRAIHLEPNNPTYYLYKGELFLHLRELELASLHIEIAAKLSTGFDQNKTQRALVDSFLGNYQQAITLLRGLPKTPEVYSLLGKIQFKARDFKNSADSFKQAIYLAERAIMPSHLVTHVTSRGDIDSSARQKVVNKKSRTDFHFFCGKSLVESGSLKEAVNEFTKVIHTTPDHDLAYYERGVAKLMDGNSKGILDLNKSLAINSKLFQSFLARAAHYGNTGRFSKAILNCNEAIRLEPASVRAYLCRGALKYHTKLYSGAISDFSTAIRLDPKHASLGHFNRALCFQATGKLQMALSDYSTVFLLVDSPGLKVLVNRALLYLELGDWSNALLDFIMAGKLVKDDPAIFQAIGYCYHRLGAIDSAIDAYTKAVSLDLSFLGAYVGRGNAYMDYLTEEGNNKSKLDYVRTLELDPSYLPARVNLAFLLQAEGKFQEAWNELTVALQKDEWYVSAREARAIISLQMGNLFGALLDINAAIQVCKSALLLTNRGVIQQFMGDIVSAMNDYTEAVKVDPQYSLAHFNVGNVLFQQRHFRQAVDSYTKALSDTDSDDSVYVNRAIAHVMLKDTEKALEDFSEAIQVNPYSAHAYFNRANLYRSLGEHTQAEQDYKQALDLQPGDWLTMYYYGEVLGKLKRQESAHEMLTTATRTEIMTS